MTIYWAPLLHIYQPPTQDIDVLKKINKECYEPLFSLINESEFAKFSLNINAVLIEMLIENDLNNAIDLLRNLVSESRLDLLGTAKFHPILPLIPKKEVFRQILMNEDIIRREFGNNWQRNGFFPPEMAISSEITSILRELGYKWVIQSGIAFPMNEYQIDWPNSTIYLSPDNLQLFFRDDILSNKISFKDTNAKEFVSQLKKIDKKKSSNNDTYIITAMDGETFGHHVKNYEKTFLKKVLDLISKDDQVEITLINSLDKLFPIEKENIEPRESSWSTTNTDLKEGRSFPLWNNDDNGIHKYFWKIVTSLNKLIDMTDKLDITNKWEIQEYYHTARWFYDQSICSDTTWWANPPNMWSPNMIYKGVILLQKAALNAQLALIASNNKSGEPYFDSILYYHSLLLMELSSISQKLYKNNRD